MMRYFDLIACLTSVKRPSASQDEEITAICSDSREARQGRLFVCLRGAVTDGHSHAYAAYLRGCRAFLCEYATPLPPDAAIAYVPDTRIALAHLAAAFYGHPERDLLLVGITGTKGKTTTALMLHRILTENGVACGYIGSNGIFYCGVNRPTENTTPSSLELYATLRQMLDAGVRAVILEVSSQAITCGRIEGLSFPVSIFTNLACDHIGEGEHPDFAHYRETKARLFSSYGCECILLNADDETSPYMLAESSATEVCTVSLADCRATLFASHLRPVRNEECFGTVFHLAERGVGDVPVYLSLPGDCNVRNALLALAATRPILTRLGIEPPPLRALAGTLADLAVAGRFTRIPTALPEVDFVIDYAHNGYSMAAAISALRAYEPRRLLCLFGSVGGRTYSRRTELAEAASSADLCILTADNPDSEPPEDTLAELAAVLEARGCEYVAIPDRAAAIRYAVNCARAGDTVLLAGKGHERYQLVNGVRLPFSEEQILRAAVEERMALLSSST